MCGRYTQTAALETLRKRFGFTPPAGLDLAPRYNLAPGQEAPVVLWEEGPVLGLLTWGLIPAWAKDPAMGSKMINARAETLKDKPSFKRPLMSRRCLVLADGFYEWRKARLPGSKSSLRFKTPVRFRLKDRDPFAFAGLWDAWQDPKGGIRRTFTIVTTQANDLIKSAHERMPVILSPEHERTWLDSKAPLELLSLLAPYPSSLMEGYDVTRIVNNPRADGPGCVEPAPEELTLGLEEGPIDP